MSEKRRLLKVIAGLLRTNKPLNKINFFKELQWLELNIKWIGLDYFQSQIVKLYLQVL